MCRSSSRSYRVSLREGACLAAACGLLGAYWPRPACADEAVLEEVTVTAQRRTERLQDVPVAVTAISGSELIARGVRQAGDIADLVPNLLLNLPYGPEAQPTFTLRGVTTQDFSENQSSPIAMYVDEVYKPVGALQSLQIYDLDRVEVLRGPQGTLYGASSMSGTIRFIPKAPDMNNIDGYLTAEGSTTDHASGNYNINGALNLPIVEGVL